MVTFFLKKTYFIMVHSRLETAERYICGVTNHNRAGGKYFFKNSINTHLEFHTDLCYSL